MGTGRWVMVPLIHAPCPPCPVPTALPGSARNSPMVSKGDRRVRTTLEEDSTGHLADTLLELWCGVRRGVARGCVRAVTVLWMATWLGRISTGENARRKEKGVPSGQRQAPSGPGSEFVDTSRAPPGIGVAVAVGVVRAAWRSGEWEGRARKRNYG